RPGVRIHLMHEDRELGRDEFVALLRLLHHDSRTTVERAVVGRLEIAVSATLRKPAGTLLCTGFYELREGLIEGIEETWIMRGAGGILNELGAARSSWRPRTRHRRRVVIRSPDVRAWRGRSRGTRARGTRARGRGAGGRAPTRRAGGRFPAPPRR